MALSREFLKRLNSEEYPLPKRLKVAETAFSSVGLPLVRKEDLLLEWLCQVCLTNQRAWKTLNDCLKSAHVDIKASVKQCVIDALELTLNSDVEDVCDEVVECSSTVLANSSIRQYFINNPKSLGSLIKALLNNMLRHSSCPNASSEEPDKILETHRELSSVQSYTIIKVIKSLTQIYNLSVTTRDELRSIFIHDILYPMCKLIGHGCTDNTNNFSIVVCKCIQQLLLEQSRSARYKRITDSGPTFSDLFSVLSKNVETLDLQSNLLTYQVIFHAVISTYKSDAVSLDKFFRNLINSAGRYKWEILYTYLKLLNDVTLNFDNIVKDVTLSEYFQKFISDILTCNMTHTQYGVLTQLAYINPLLIEKNVSGILDKILMDEETTDYTNLLIAILHASTKLRREPNFIMQLLTSLKGQIAARETCRVKASAFFPREIKTKLVQTISSFSNKQATAILRTLIYYLNTDCLELLQCDSSCKNVLILKATVELLVILFEGIQIFEYTRTLPAHEKLINALDELGGALSQLINKSLCLTHNKNITIVLLSAVLSLSEVQNMLKYYVPRGAVTKKLSFPILDDSWQQLIQRITNFGEDNCKTVMNKLILHRIKLNVSSEPIKLDSLIIGGIEYSWSTILQHDIDVLPLLRDRDISKVTHFLLADMTSSENNFQNWRYILVKECLQENRRFIMYLSSHILAHIGQSLSLGCTKSIIEHINAKLLMEENDKLLEILQVIKELISQKQWIQVANDTSSKIVLHLKILSLLPTIYLRPNVRTLLFLVVYSISRECEANDTVLTLCNTIFSELLEKPGVDIFQYIEPTILVNQLMQNKAFSKACEFSFRNVTTYDILKRLIKSCAQCKKVMCILLESMEIVKPKLNTEQKAIFKKAEKKLAKAILKLLPGEMDDVFDVRCLIAVLKVIILTNEVPESLKRLTELTLRNLFTTKEDLGDTSDNTLLEQSVQLAVIVLRHRKTFAVEDAIIKSLWSVMLTHPCKNSLELLLESTGPKEFNEFLKTLYDKTINSLSQTDETMWTNLFVIWSGIMKVNMSSKRNKIRLFAVSSLLETVELLDIPDKCWPNLLHLSHDIIATKHLLIPDSMIDLIVIIGLKSLDRVKISSCKNVLAICRTLINVRTNLITDKLPILLLLYRAAVNTIVHASKSVVDKFEEHRFKNLAFDIEKVTRLLIKLKKDMTRLSVYLIADLLQLIIEGAAPSYIKTALQNALCQLLSICDQHGIAFLSRALPTSLQEVFKVQLDMFNKFYKYSGKI